MTTTPQLDTVDLSRQIKALYRRVALEPHASYHFPLGRPLAEQLGYPADLLDRIPTEALASFAGVGYALDLARPWQTRPSSVSSPAWQTRRRS